MVGCLSHEAKQFIESKDTQTEVKLLIEEQLDQLAVPVKTLSREAMYEPVGKGGENEDKTRVDFKTLNDLIFYGMAFVEVDTEANPRQLLDVTDTGLIDEQGYDLYDAIIEYTFLSAYETAFTDMKYISCLLSI